MKIENNFTDLRNGQQIDVSSNYGTEKDFLELVNELLKEKNWIPSKDAKVCINAQVKNYWNGN